MKNVHLKNWDLPMPKKSILGFGLLAATLSGWGSDIVVEVGDWTFGCNRVEGGVELGGLYSSSSGPTGVQPNVPQELVIPETLKGQLLVGLGLGSLQNGLFTKVQLPSGLRYIGCKAFSCCTNIVEVELPDGLKNLDADAFWRCYSLSDITLPNSVTNIGSSAFCDCHNLKSVVFPEELRAIGSSAFSGCKLDSVDLSNCKTRLVFESSVFCNNDTLKTLILPKSCIIPSSAFREVCAIQNVTLSSRLVGELRSLFAYSWTSLKSVRFYDDGATRIPASAFANCTSLTNVVLPSTMMSIGANAFSNCTSLAEITIPASVITIDASAFGGCTALRRVTFEGDAPDIIGEGLFFGTPKRLEVRVPRGSVGWGTGVSSELPSVWNDRVVVHSDEKYDWHEESAINELTVALVSTNVVVHYVVNSIQPEFAIPASQDMGFLNIVTEVRSGGAISIPITWAMNYPSFTEKFGGDFTKALMRPTGKRDALGNSMLVWQDYVAGTDPTDEDDVFRASITIVDGKPVVSYSPELDDERKALRKYTIYGKGSLMDSQWKEINETEVANYHFFKVVVEMR